MAVDRGHHHSQSVRELTGMRFLTAILFLAFFASASLADVPRQIGWKDLASGLSSAENPYYGLSADEARLVGILVDTAAMREPGETLSPRALEGEAIALAALDSIGIDGRTKVQEVAAFGAKLKTSRTELNDSLLGQVVEIPGFVLPLEFDGMTVKEFILVPYAGACIHTPPPPSNQMIIVRTSDGFELGGLFEPVVVSGTLAQGGENRAVGLSDGEAEFEVGYQMKATSVQTF